VEIAAMTLEEYRESYMGSIRGGAEECRQAIIRRIGITCLTECNHNMLMWANYSNKHKGFCREFQTSDPIFRQVHKVLYADTPAPRDVSEATLLSSGEQFINAFFIKTSIWAYEREWRGIHLERDKSYYYETQMLKAVYIGARMGKPERETLLNCLGRSNPAAEAWTGVLDRPNHSVRFERIN
jgi:hypothetical protein